MQDWVIIDERYLNYLRKIEPRIPNSDYGADKFKPFFGVLFEVGGLVYVTQISHAQVRHERMKNAPDFIKIYISDHIPTNPDRLAAVVNLNYMFPVPKTQIEKLEYKSIDRHRTFKTEAEKSRYIDLLTKEMAKINTLDIDKRAVNLYDRKKRFPDDFVSRRCLDFCGLEIAAGHFPEHHG